MGCSASKKIETRILPPAAVVKLVETLSARFELLQEGERSVLGTDRGFQITLFLERTPSGIGDLAQLFLQHFSLTMRETMIILHSHLNPSGGFEILLMGVVSMCTLRVFSEEFADPFDPLIEIWAERLKAPKRKIWTRQSPSARTLMPIQN